MYKPDISHLYQPEADPLAELMGWNRPPQPIDDLFEHEAPAIDDAPQQSSIIRPSIEKIDPQDYINAMRQTQGNRDAAIRLLIPKYGQLPLSSVYESVNNIRLPYDGSDWRQFCWSFDELPKEPPQFLLQGLVEKSTLTFIVGQSYNCKSWLALSMAKCISEGMSFVDYFDGPGEPVPILYHVPDMHAAMVRKYMSILGIKNTEMFLVRPMELGMWTLASNHMLKSAQGRLIFLDVTGYFNPVEDTNSYQDSYVFAELIINLIAEGCLGVVGLYHPPKKSPIMPYKPRKKEGDEPTFQWSLENSIIGSAGYGGILRSCLRVRNMATDKNDDHPILLVAPLKNPGLHSFTLEEIPLTMKDLGKNPAKAYRPLDSKATVKAAAFELFAAGKSYREILDTLTAKFRDAPTSTGTLANWHKEWEQRRSVDRSVSKQPGKVTLQ